LIPNEVFMFKIQFFGCLIVLLVSCTHQKREPNHSEHRTPTTSEKTVIIDCRFTFEESVNGSNAPKEILDQLKLINVQYYSTDHKIHQGQVLANQKIADKIDLLFKYMLFLKFPIAHAIPVVNYHWDDELSMQSNNTYSFCYRDISFSKHAHGMAIDINPYFNPERWKAGYENRVDKPEGAHYDPNVPGTFYKLHPVVQELKKLGFRWGHTFTEKMDDHHFEM